MITKIVAGLLLSLATLAACSEGGAKQRSSSDSRQTIQGENIVSFKIDGVPVQTSGYLLSRFIFKKTGAIHLAISSNMREDTRTVKANIGGIAPGTYSFSENSTHTYGHYYPDFDKDIFDHYGFVSGSFTITELDSVKHRLNATFAGKVRNAKGQEREITEGKIINGKLKPTMDAF